MTRVRSCKACDHKDRELSRLRGELQTVIELANGRIKIAEDRETYLQSRFLELMRELKILREAKGLNLEMLTLSAKIHAPC